MNHKNTVPLFKNSRAKYRNSFIWDYRGYDIGDDELPSFFVGIIMNHEEPYQPTELNSHPSTKSPTAPWFLAHRGTFQDLLRDALLGGFSQPAYSQRVGFDVL